MNQIEVDILCLCLALLGMVTRALLDNSWESLSEKKSTSPLSKVIDYFLIVLLWKHKPGLAMLLLAAIVVMTSFSLIYRTARNEPWMTRTLNWMANAGLMGLLFIILQRQ